MYYFKYFTRDNKNSNYISRVIVSKQGNNFVIDKLTNNLNYIWHWKTTLKRDIRHEIQFYT